MTKGKLLHTDNSLYLRVPYGRKFLGKLARTKDDEIFITHVKDPEKHYYIKGQGYAINYELLIALHHRGIRNILIPEDGKTGFRTYLTTVDDYIQGEGVYEDEDAQRVVPLLTLSPIPVEREKILSYLR